jgi:hypothetical protein
MSATTTLLYVVGILGFFAVIFYTLINKLFNKPVDFTKKKREEREQKKSSKVASGKKSK